MPDLFDFLYKHSITFERFDHPPVYTVEDVRRLVPDLPGAKTKNLFFRDEKGKRYLLVLVPDEKRVDMKQLPKLVGWKRISLGSPKRLKKYLGVDPGAVSLLAVFNDTVHAVKVIIDRRLWQSDAFQFHPLVNTSTLVISKNNIKRFLAATGHSPVIIDVPVSD